MHFWRPFWTYLYPPEELLEESKRYFDYCDDLNNSIDVNGRKVKKPKSIAWLASWLWVAKSYISNKSKEPTYSEMIEYIRQEIEEDVAQWAMVWMYNPTVAVKNLSANFDWKDKSEIDNNHSWSISIWSLLKEIQWVEHKI